MRTPVLSTEPPTVDPSAPPAADPVCEAPGCDELLTDAQVARGARACSPACRAKAHRGARKARRLAEIDRAIRTLTELRDEIARTP